MNYLACYLALFAALSIVGRAAAEVVPPAAAVSAMERAQRDADKVFRIILQHANIPRRAAREERKPAVSRAAAAPRAAASAPAAPAPALATTAPIVEVAPASAPALEAAPPVGVATPTMVAVTEPRPAELELLSSVEPEFPAHIMRTLGSGSVTVNFDVRADGTVYRTAVVRSSHRGLNAAAEAAVAAWRFKPTGRTLPGLVELKFE